MPGRKIPHSRTSCPDFRQPIGTGCSQPVDLVGMSKQNHPHQSHSASARSHDRFDAPDGAVSDGTVSDVTAEGAAWLASAGTYPRSTLAQWEERPTTPVVLPCGTVFDVVNVPALFGRRMLDRLWDEGPGSGPVADVPRAHAPLRLARHRPATAALLAWEEWGSPGRTGAVPPLLCHGPGDAVTVPALHTAPHHRAHHHAHHRAHDRTRRPARVPLARRPRHPRTVAPGPEVLLWAVRPSGPFRRLRGGTDIDFSSRRSEC